MSQFIVTFKFTMQPESDTKEDLESVLVGERDNWARGPYDEVDSVEIGTPREV